MVSVGDILQHLPNKPGSLALEGGLVLMWLPITGGMFADRSLSGCFHRRTVDTRLHTGTVLAVCRQRLA